MAQACAINAIQRGEPAERVQQLTTALVTCAMTSRYPPSAVPQVGTSILLLPIGNRRYYTITPLAVLFSTNQGKILLAQFYDRPTAVHDRAATS